MGIELVVFATVFTLIVLLTGGPGNGVQDEWIRNLCGRRTCMVDDTDHCTGPITVFNSLEAGVCLAVPEN